MDLSIDVYVNVNLSDYVRKLPLHPASMNALEHELNYPLQDTLPSLSEALPVAEGVRWIRMVLPFALNHINLWLLRDEMDGENGKIQGWTVVDCCIDRAESRAQWQGIFDTQLEGLPILRVICTHMHPDHIGLAHWICAKWKVRLWISATDYNVARNLCTSEARTQGTPSGHAAAEFYAAHGLVDPESVAKIKARTSYYSGLVPAVPESYHRMMEGDEIRIGGRNWRCISGYGHAPEHIALYLAPTAPTEPAPQGGAADLGAAQRSAPILISGDMVLPRISTNVSVFDLEPEGNPLQLFLSSINKYLELPADTLVLPSHGKPFIGMHQRIAQLHSHHADRLAEVMQACSEKPTSGAEIVPIMFKRELDLHQMTFAMGEAVAHLHMLWYAGSLTRTCDADGVYRFSTKSPIR
jgi:glyoxylase-like metal-dependent hydrolase (beta-lactamase superfamily II)